MLIITIDEKEQVAFNQLLDVALRHSGMGALDTVAHFKVKLDQAQKAEAAAIESAEKEKSAAAAPEERS